MMLPKEAMTEQALQLLFRKEIDRHIILVGQADAADRAGEEFRAAFCNTKAEQHLWRAVGLLECLAGADASVAMEVPRECL